jgi:hypothetical protein
VVLSGNAATDFSAFGRRDAAYAINIVATWPDSTDDDAHLRWVREFAVQPYTDGVYVNFLGDEGDSCVREAFTPQQWKRLVELKRKWDPNNVFRHNQNITPARTDR